MAEPAITAASKFVAKSSPKLAELDGFGSQIRDALAKVEEVATRADTRLRTEIDAASGVIHTAIGKLKAQVDELALATAAARALPQSTSVGAPSPAPGLGGQELIDALYARSEEIARAVDTTQQRVTTTEGRVNDAEAMLSRHDNGLMQLAHVVRRLDERGPRQATAQAQQPVFGANLGANFQGGASGAAAPAREPEWQDPERLDLSAGKRPRPTGPWKLYDEKYLLDSRNAFNSKDQSTWLEDLKDYLSGRTPSSTSFSRGLRRSRPRSCAPSSTRAASTVRLPRS